MVTMLFAWSRFVACCCCCHRMCFLLAWSALCRSMSLKTKLLCRDSESGGMSVCVSHILFVLPSWSHTCQVMSQDTGNDVLLTYGLLLLLCLNRNTALAHWFAQVMIVDVDHNDLDDRVAIIMIAFLMVALFLL
eukprot:6087861-Amphidinium_carterae.1